MDFVAIDFETANGNASSACQLAAVVVRDSQIVREHSWLIRPPRMYFSPRNIAVHGIRPADVQAAPKFDGIWSELQAVLEGQVLMAHNARFDIGVLVASLAAFDIACPDTEFSCTRLLARCAWPGRSRYGLKPLGQWLGIDFKHHDALEDARTCAKIALQVERVQELRELGAVEEKLRITRGGYRQGTITSPRKIGSHSAGQGGRFPTDRWGVPSRAARVGDIDPGVVLTAAAEQQPLAGKTIVLLGPLRGMDLQSSQALIAKLGGRCLNEIAPGTNYVVACGTTLDEAGQRVCRSLAEGVGGVEVQSTGIRVLSERQFRALLPAGKASVRW